MAELNLDAELVMALALARGAGQVVLRMQRGELGVEMKPGDEPVTIADKRASKLIVDGLSRQFPKDAIISEELPPPSGALGSSRVWFVDPIDGTKDFIRGETGYSVMIGLCLDGHPILGVVYQPALDRTFFATPDGAWMETGHEKRELAVSDVSDVTRIRLVASKSHRSDKLDEVKQALGIANEENVGSVGVKLCLIAMGDKELYVNPWPKTKPWDTCGPQAILERAGGRLTDVHGAGMDYARLVSPNGLVASNGRVHDAVLARLAPLFP